MTIGYPDNIRESKQGGSLLQSASVKLDGSNAPPAIYVGNYQYLIVTIDGSSTAHYPGIVFSFYSNSSLSISLGNSVGAIASGIIDSIIVRVRGPWFSMTPQGWDASSTDSVNVYVFGADMLPIPSIGSVGIGQWAYYNANIAANGNATVGPTPWHSGVALISIMSGVATNLILTCQQYQYRIGWQTYLNTQQSVGANRGNTLEIPIPPTPVRFQLVNGSTATNCYFLASPRDLVAA